MLGRLFGRGAGSGPADPYALPAPRRQKNGMYELRALGDTRVLALVEAARAGDWEAVKAASAPFDLGGRDHRVLGELADVDGVQDWIGRAVEEDEEHRATALLISGARHVIWGWEARTSARAKHVTREQWKVFGERLTVADEHLLRAAELRPEWIAPWRHLLTSCRGMSLGRAVGEARRDAALRRDPLDLPSNIEWVSQLQPRWSGEPGEALAFAQAAVAGDRVPDGHRLHGLIAFAYVEEWVESEVPDTLERPAVRKELREAAERGVLHPDYERRPGWQYDFNLFAMALSLAGELATARRVFKELDGAMTDRPWGYFAEPHKQFARFLARA